MCFSYRKYVCNLSKHPNFIGSYRKFSSQPLYHVCNLFITMITVILLKLIYFKQSDRPSGGGGLRPLQDQVRGLCGGGDGGGAGGDPPGGQGGGQGTLRHIRKVSVESSVEFFALFSLF